MDHALLADWITIWQSELAALCVDREMHEAAQRGVNTWAANLDAIARLSAVQHDAARPAGTVAAAGTAPAAAASDDRDRVIAGLLERVEQLERRVAELGTA